MRVLHVQKVKGIGGSERHLLSLLPALVAAGDEVRMVVLAPGDRERDFVDALRDAVEVVQVPTGANADPRPVAGLVKHIRSYRPDLVHTHLVHADVWGQAAARVAMVRALRTFHDVQPFFRREPVRSAARVAGRLARRTIAISEHVAGFVRALDLAPRDRIRVVPYGIEVRPSMPTAAERGEARSRLGLPARGLVVGMASRLIPGKGHALAIDACERAGITLVVAGDGPLRGELERRASANARFLGHIVDVGGFMVACDVLVFPTMPVLGEGFGLAALEAMAEGRPVIATRVGALPEVVEDGVTGLIAEPDPDDLAAALSKLAGDRALRERMGRAGRARAAARFGLDRMVERTRAVYAEVLS